jgi:hypothetical protein
VSFRPISTSELSHHIRRWQSSCTSSKVRLAVLNSVVTVLAGFRWIELRDQLSYSFNHGVLTTAFDDNNHLYGGQIGTDWALLNNGGPLRLNAALKAGAYGNVADNTFSANAIFANTGSNAAPLAFVGDITVAASYQLSSHWSIRGGYQLLWIDRLALASNNAVSAAAAGLGAGVNTSGGLFYNGAMASVQFVW